MLMSGSLSGNRYFGLFNVIGEEGRFRVCVVEVLATKNNVRDERNIVKVHINGYDVLAGTLQSITKLDTTIPMYPMYVFITK